MEILLYLFALLVALIYVWMWVAGDREQDIEDDEPQTLNTRGPEVTFSTSYDDDRPADDGPWRNR